MTSTKNKKSIRASSEKVAPQKPLPNLSKGEIINIAFLIINVIFLIINFIPTYLDYFKASRNVLGAINSFDVTFAKNTEIKASFINTGSKDVAITNIIVVGFFNSLTTLNEADISKGSEYEEFEINPMQILPKTPINIESEKMESLSVYVNLEPFTLNDPPILAYPEINDVSFIPLIDFDYTFKFEILPMRAARFCDTRNINFAFLLTLLDANGNTTISMMPISQACEYLKYTENHTNTIDLFDEKYVVFQIQ